MPIPGAWKCPCTRVKTRSEFYDPCDLFDSPAAVPGPTPSYRWGVVAAQLARAAIWKGLRYRSDLRMHIDAELTGLSKDMLKWVACACIVLSAQYFIVFAGILLRVGSCD